MSVKASEIDVLVLAQTVDLEKTSEGIVTSKFIRLISQKYNSVVIVNGSDECYDKELKSLPWLPGIEVLLLDDLVPQNRWGRLLSLLQEAKKKAPQLAWLWNKFHALVGYTWGFSIAELSEVAKWTELFEQVVSRMRPAAIFVRGAGSNFTTAMAASRVESTVPWIVNYHDPFPLSLYPEPYRYSVRIISGKQQRAHYKILNKASALTFPSKSLRDWILQADNAKHKSKAWVIPHIATELQDFSATSDFPDALRKALNSRRLKFLHMGTLLGPRKPDALLQAYLEFLDRSPEARSKVLMLFVGKVNKTHQESIESYSAQLAENLMVFEERVHYQDSLHLANNSDVLILLEHAAEISPFLPAKVTDYVSIDKPILSLTPAMSATRDALGYEYPLHAKADSVEEILSRIELIWLAWENGTLDEYRPPKEAREMLSETTVLRELEHLLNALLERPQ